MEGDFETYLSVLEDNHWVMVKSVDPEVFLDYMRQHRVLSEDDCQVVQNCFINQTRRARMRCFLDIIRTKGPENIKLFFQQLGWEYPHVYREVFRQEPNSPPQSYRQDTKSRLSCDLNQLLTFGLDMKRLQNQKEDLADQIKDMEAMLKHQKNEIEDLERENQRLRKYERDNQHNKEKLRTLTLKNEEIKEENRQFLHEIRTLTLDLRKQCDQEASLQAKLDEMTQQIQEKSFELSRKDREESDLRAKYEHVRKESLKLQSLSQARTRRQGFAAQNNLQHQLEILTDDMKNMEEKNRELCEQLHYMQNLLDTEKDERDQLHRCVCALELDKNTLETRQATFSQKIERYFSKIKQLEEEKRKLEEERMHMQTKMWEMSQINEKQFEQQHKLENRYDQLQESYEHFRQDHRYCIPGEPLDKPPRHRLPGMKDRPGPPCRPCLSPCTSLGKDDPFKRFSSFCAAAIHHEEGSSQSNMPDGTSQPESVINPASQNQSGVNRHDSLTVNVSTSMKKKEKPEDAESADESDNDVASTVSELSSVSSSTFDIVYMNDICSEPATARSAAPQQSSESRTGTGNFFIRSNVKEDGEGDTIAVQEGDILYVIHTDEDKWKVMRVDRTSGKTWPHQQGYIPNPDSTSGKVVRRNTSDASNKPLTLERKYAIRREVVRPQHSFFNNYTTVYPMKATRLLPVLLLCPTPAITSLLSCMETTARDWATIIHDGEIESSSQLFAQSCRHKVLPWEVRPKDPQKYNNNLHKFIIITVTLQSQDALVTFRHLLGEPGLTMDVDQEMKYLKERQDMVTHAGLHSATVTVMAGQDDRDAFWMEVKDKVALVQQQVFWLESNPLSH
ncbi:uncharacterized protein LOC143279555 isoform X2 [Babylonia areolata]|uniref:uncharacterized protein LOC143279555 isoform X2 n=1 Tax=Babylonia areolata TaxID=304850 RepID=UPI003FD437F3